MCNTLNFLIKFYIMILKKIVTLLSLSLLVSACIVKEKPINLALKYSNDKGPNLDIKDYLNGNLKGGGFFEDSNGLITKRFTTKVKGSWDGDKGIVKRQFTFDNGKKDSRTWLVTLDKDNFSAVGHAVIGTARGQQYKGVAKMVYKIEMPFDGLKQKTTVTEMTYNIDGKSTISILEFKVGRKNKGKMILSLHKVSEKTAKKAVKVKSLEKKSTIEQPEKTEATQ